MLSITQINGVTKMSKISIDMRDTLINEFIDLIDDGVSRESALARVVAEWHDDDMPKSDIIDIIVGSNDY